MVPDVLVKQGTAQLHSRECRRDTPALAQAGREDGKQAWHQGVEGGGRTALQEGYEDSAVRM